MNQEFTIILFYKYTPVEKPTELQSQIKAKALELNLKGRVIVAGEGINGTLEGINESTNQFIDWLKTDLRFIDVDFKKSLGDGKAFKKLSVKVRNEIVAYRLEQDIKPWEVTGKYLYPDQLRQWFLEKKQFIIVDMRNGFEQEVGRFENSILSEWEHSENIPQIKKTLEGVGKDMLIVTVCTGGVRCEKASGFLINHGFTNVYQLYGGIHSYIEKYPNQEFKGLLYTFDSRLVMGFNLEDPSREIIGKCKKCNKKTEKFINCEDGFCNRHFLICEQCLGGKDKILCPQGCRDYSREHPEAMLGG